MIRVNVSLIGSYIIRGPEFISISSHFLPLWMMKNELYIAELKILWIGTITVIL